MKNYIIAFLTFIICSCNSAPDTNLILGRWRINNMENSTGMSIIDTMSFFENDSVSFVSYVNGKPANLLAGHFTSDKIAKTITINYSLVVSKDFIDGKTLDSINDTKKVMIKLNILKLNEKELELFSDSTKAHIKLVRY